MATSALPTNYLIVGAGAGGLTVARALLRYGIEFEIAERHSDLGGIWNIDNPGSPMYETCHMITSRIAGGFVGFPMPDDYPMYPRWENLFSYIRSFAEAYGLVEHIRFSTEVRLARPVHSEDGTYWEVAFADGQTRTYRGVISATGSQWQPVIPDIAGRETFTGRAIHSKDYRSTDEFVGKRVLVIGAGNSGVDIAVDAALHGKDAFLSTRRAYHFLPKQIFGVALPDFMDGISTLPDLPFLRDLTWEERLELVLATSGDLSKFGLPKPEGPLGQTHPIVSNTVLHAISHGLLKPRPDVSGISGSTVTFTDGSQEDVDVIIYATGYTSYIDWVPDGLVEYLHGHPKLHLETFVPGVDGLYVVGAIHAAVGAAWTMCDIYANLAAADAHATLTGENAENLRRLKEEYDPDFDRDFPFLDVPRNSNHHDPVAVMKVIPEEIRTRFGIALPKGYDDVDFYASVGSTRAPGPTQALDSPQALPVG